MLELRSLNQQKNYEHLAFFFSDIEVEMYTTEFNKTSGYQLYLLPSIVLPTTAKTYANIDLSLGFFLAFKVYNHTFY
ncbi:uncharacterized protein BX663DRAFT_274452 [Cokeromyces recurvatus]|uniref:uncharacterized protein n=1 Tax=Cokeromyces recurvatus TaxID=90255 RepID=UPI00221FDABD|nr:uncharacterized protein BX663DRAFT_274452 [Cokeromyces recurvatus]KAI7897923.1 hypothetical protein BX663DRAFT_274452 [Cokeromyces recurvatus]